MSEPKPKKDKTKSDPTENPDFKKVVSHFLNSPPKPHDQSKKGGGKGAKAKRANDE
jgi:hypothetical protein